MRDLFVTLAVFGCLPMILYRPHIGVLVWAWLSYMNPHRLAWGFSTTMPFAFIVAITVFIAYIFSKEPKRIPWSREVVVLLLFLAWMFITTLNAINHDAAWTQWDKVWRIQLMTVVTLMLMYTRERVQLLVWTIAMSLSFYGVKGGIWVLMSGGAHRVYGPSNTFIGGNNELGVALIMTLPLLWYLRMQSENQLLRYGLIVIISLTLVAIIGTHSRGALVGVAVMAVLFFLKSRQKLLPLVLGLAFVAVIPQFMPQTWFDRMHTIETYEEDNSATERLRAWSNAIDLASQRFMGGGYDALIYWGGRDAHSIYFEVLGEHGYVGLVLFLSLGLMAWLKASSVIRLGKNEPELKWAGDLAAMVQVSMVGYAAGGAFLGLAYFDYIYHLIAIIVLIHMIARQHLAQAADQPQTAVRPLPRTAAPRLAAGRYDNQKGPD